MKVPSTWSGLPVSAPVWVWVFYVVGITALGALTGGLGGVYVVAFVALFSFQFWTFAVWRGLCKAQTREDEGVVAALAALERVEAVVLEAESGAGVWGTCSHEWLRIESLREALDGA